ncbi:MAG: hypothetical protein CVU65_11925 [Deltaproteobacteria bacterium HGW-Deltaproteobacteria-22]|jgi:hypothetical protein|nr:MAG: hypothetical protein CVU65_11925 [Deltaproteobacteria bacterium HGW-Deltaproteobacteria-22]
MNTFRMRIVFLILILSTMFALPASSMTAGKDIDEFLIKDPVAQKWLILKKAKAGETYIPFGMYTTGSKHEALTKECDWSVLTCKTGYKAFAGTPDAAWNDFWVDSLSHTEDKEWGTNPPIWKLNSDSYVGVRAATAAPVWNFPNAAALIAKTINTPQKMETLWYFRASRESYKQHPYRALWRLGAKEHADVLIARMELKCEDNRHCAGDNRIVFLMTADAWKLSATQNAAIAKICAEAFVGDEAWDTHAVGPCLRYFGRTKTADTTMLTFIKRLMGTGDSKLEAARAAAYIPIKEKAVINDFLKRVEQNKQERTEGRKKIISYNNNYDIAIGAIGLFGMGEADGEKVIDDFVGWDKAKSELTNPNGWVSLMAEAPFVAETHRKKLIDKIKKVLPNVEKKIPKDSQYQRYTRVAACALLQLGDKAGLEPALDILKGNDDNEVKELVTCLGEKAEEANGNSVGLGSVRVGKDALTEKEARQLIDAIKAGFATWQDEGMKRSALNAALDIEARIKASR